ncbi:unnamed protein product, partial [Rotaria sp. Silwood1]
MQQSLQQTPTTELTVVCNSDDGQNITIKSYFNISDSLEHVLTTFNRVGMLPIPPNKLVLIKVKNEECMREVCINDQRQTLSALGIQHRAILYFALRNQSRPEINVHVYGPAES